MSKIKGELHIMNALQRLSEIRELPTLPEVALKIRTLIYSEESDASMLARMIEQDPSLSATILKLANSPFYCHGNKINSVQMAVTRLGFSEVGHIALAISFIKNFSKKSELLNYKQFWRHSLVAAYLCAMTGEVGSLRTSTIESHQLFLSGLLHDIGILIYDQYFHEEFQDILDYACQKEISFLEAERSRNSSETHAVLGSALLELWKIDLQVVSGVRYHHLPDKAPNKFSLISSATYLSEYILCNSGLGHFEGSIGKGNKAAIEILQLTPDTINSYLRLAEFEVQRSDLMVALETDNSFIQLRTI